MAAETLASAGVAVTVVDHMATAGRKFLVAGRGGLNMTHSESSPQLLERYRPRAPQLVAAINAFGPDEVIAWANGLGEATFVGTSGRIFPVSLRATPLLRAWLDRLRSTGVEFRFRQRFTGWSHDGSVLLESATGVSRLDAGTTILALGGASWPRTGSDGSWADILSRAGVVVERVRPANNGFGVGVDDGHDGRGVDAGRGADGRCDGWSEHFSDRFAWKPLKNVRVTFGAASARGELMITASGIEGGAIYAVGAAVREAIERTGVAEITIDLHPDISEQEWTRRLSGGRRRDSSATRLRRAGLSPVAIGLLRETDSPDESAKAVRLRLTGVAPIDRAISTAGGVSWDEIDDSMMLRRLPGVFVAGEMIDWEAPTGGYLLQGCFSLGVAAARGAVAHLSSL